MGEFAKHNGEGIKLGTCENMYYLRADQRHLVHGGDAPSNFSPEGLSVIRFRFPFPDEDAIAPGAFEDYRRGVRIPGYSLPETLSGDEHGNVQFRSDAGYVLSIPCPEGRRQPGDSMSTDVDGIRVGRNGFNGYPVIRQQALRGGVWVTIVYCGACGAIHRLDTIEDAEPVAEAFMAEAAREEYRRDIDGFGLANSETHRKFLLEMAARIIAGYNVREEIPA